MNVGGGNQVHDDYLGSCKVSFLHRSYAKTTLHCIPTHIVCKNISHRLFNDS